jgi:peptidoglycan glycosyltransferase
MKYLLLIIFISFNAQANFNFFKKRVKESFNPQPLLELFNTSLFKSNQIPEKLIYDTKEYEFHNEINWKMMSYIERTIRSYRPDYVSVVIIDNNTGRIIAVTDYTRATKEFGKRLSFSTTNPAASVFKVITAADLLENSKVNTESYFTYNGKGSTLYKYQLKDKKNRWTRKRTLKKAFALSNNVIFGKAAQKNLSSKSLNKMAFKFGFYRELMDEVDMSFIHTI